MSPYNNYGYGQQSYYNGALPDRMAQPFPNYQPSYLQQQSIPAQNNLQQPAQQNNGIIWVQGEEGAKAYLVAPNSTVVLWDSESPIIYIKSADMNGMPSTRIFDLTERTTQRTAPLAVNNSVEYATKDEFSALADKVNELIEKEQRRQERYEKKKGGVVNNG